MLGYYHVECPKATVLLGAMVYRKFSKNQKFAVKASKQNLKKGLN